MCLCLFDDNTNKHSHINHDGIHAKVILCKTYIRGRNLLIRMFQYSARARLSRQLLREIVMVHNECDDMRVYLLVRWVCIIRPVGRFSPPGSHTAHHTLLILYGDRLNKLASQRLLAIGNGVQRASSFKFRKENATTHPTPYHTTRRVVTCQTWC